jgi:hypothetical protein
MTVNESSGTSGRSDVYELMRARIGFAQSLERNAPVVEGQWTRFAYPYVHRRAGNRLYQGSQRQIA